jgi:hypothetical protein
MRPSIEWLEPRTLCSTAQQTVGSPAPLAAPSGLTADVQPSDVQLRWTDNATVAGGYRVLRSMDVGAFELIATVHGRRASAFSDKSVKPGQAYAYEVQAYYGRRVSAYADPVAVTIPTSVSAAPLPLGVSIATRFGDELTVTVSGTRHSIVLSQSGETVSVDVDGEIYAEPLPTAGVFVYTRGGRNAVAVGPSVSVRTTIETIDNARTIVTSAGSNVSAWIDSTDAFSGTGDVHRVGRFAGGVSKSAGASLPEPSDAGATTTVNLSLWGTGPVASDVNQGSVGDCYFLASLAAFAGANPVVLTYSAVDMGDGTYVVRFQSRRGESYVRVNGDMATGPFGGYMFAHPGPNNTLWAMVLEKALAFYRTRANTYSSLSSGWMDEAYADFGVKSANFVPSASSENAFYGMVTADLSNGEAVTLTTFDSPPDLLPDHTYTLVSASADASGVTHYVVRNPWGSAGDGLEDSQGYATLSFAQVIANFEFGYQAVS